jgi:hypothetical protein
MEFKEGDIVHLLANVSKEKRAKALKSLLLVGEKE